MGWWVGLQPNGFCPVGLKADPRRAHPVGLKADPQDSGNALQKPLQTAKNVYNYRRF